MPKIPEGAKTPTDHLPAIQPESQPEGWELLRPPIDVEFYEQAELVATVAKIKTRGAQIDLTSSNISTIGKVAKLLQLEFAVDSNAFREWIRSKGDFTAATETLLPLIYAYVNALGEAESSAS
ncbi:MAG: hypothetical protein J0H96_11920 [Microbacterium ginsengisoli]|jgi:hypothetical protein|nr:hypothetical protein [Microbacterium ginsengisoli]